MNKIDFTVGVDIAFNNNITKLLKKSYSKTLDIQYGIYNDYPYKGFLTINLKPSKGIKDWIINLVAIPNFDGAHLGYEKEIEKWWKDIYIDIMHLVSENKIDLSKGILVSGRSKGAAEALLMIPYLRGITDIKVCCAIEPPKVCTEFYAKEYIINNCKNIVITCYKNDIVPGIPIWLKHPVSVTQIEKRNAIALSIKDHEKATTDEDIFYNYINTTL